MTIPDKKNPQLHNGTKSAKISCPHLKPGARQEMSDRFLWPLKPGKKPLEDRNNEMIEFHRPQSAPNPCCIIDCNPW